MGNPVTALFAEIGTLGRYRFFYGDTSLDVASVTSSNEQVVYVQEKAAGVSYYTFQFGAFGEAVLTVTAGSDTYTVHVTVSTPQVGLYKERRIAEEYFAIGNHNTINYYDLNEGTVWLMSANGFTEEEVGRISVWDRDTETQLSIPKSGEVRTDGTTYDVKFVLPSPTGINGYTFVVDGYGSQSIQATVIGAATCGPVQIDGGKYAVGFGSPGEGTAVSIFDGYGYNKQTVVNEDPANPYEWHSPLEIFAGKKMSEGVNGYEDASSVVSFTVTKMGVDVFSGPTDAFSFDPDNFVAEISDATGAQLYFKTGYLAEGRVWADVSVTYSGQTTNHRVSMTVYVWKDESTSISTPADESLDTLNELLADLAAEAQAALAADRNSEKIYTVNLPATVYEGDIVIPKGFQDGHQLVLYGVKDLTGETRTVIQGGIDLNGASVGGINNITFQGTGEETAISGGGCGVSECAFYDYNVALKSSSAGMVKVTRSLFVDNDVAYLVDVGGLEHDQPGYPDENTFVDNGTAVLVKSLNTQINPFNFRPVGNTFIDNTVDFDVQCEGTFYFYKNYFGTKVTPEMDRAEFLAKFGAAWTTAEVTALTTRCAAKLSVASDANTTVIANPCRSLPADAWWHFYIGESPEVLFPGATKYQISHDGPDMPYWFENVLTSSWNTATQIVNNEADGLKLDASAFDADGEKVINVVEASESEETALGTWTFDEGGNA